MTNRIRIGRALALLLVAGSVAPAQLIPVKTLPVAASEQFSFFPSAGLTGGSLTLADTMLDPFRNPAAGSRVGASRYFGAPTFFTVSEGAGGGTTFPMGMFLRRGNSFGAIGAAFQQIDNPRASSPFLRGVTGLSIPPGGPVDGVEQQPTSRNNNYAFALFGHAIDSGRTSFAVSALWSGLESLDGVDHFYTGNSSLTQTGDALDLRVGVLKELRGGRSIEAVALRHRFAMAHDVGFTDFVWEPALGQPVARPRTEHNSDRAGVWGLHLEYEHPLDSGWRVGALATVNLIQLPSIPRYEITSGLGREGKATAMNFGVGLGRTFEQLAVGLDAIYEPIASNTWVTDTLDNRFRFHNAKLRGGISRDFKLLTPGNLVRMHFDAEYHWINYVLDQDDFLMDVARSRTERWLERTRGGGVSFVTPNLQLHYSIQTRSGVGRPGVVSADRPIAVPEIAFSPWELPPATGTALGAVNVTRHQFSISVPVR